MLASCCRAKLLSQAVSEVRETVHNRQILSILKGTGLRFQFVRPVFVTYVTKVHMDTRLLACRRHFDDYSYFDHKEEE